MPWVADVVKSEPTLLYFEGQFLDGAMRRERITRSEVRAAIRAEGLAEMEGAAAVVLETDSSLTVLRAREGQRYSALHGVAGAPSGTLNDGIEGESA